MRSYRWLTIAIVIAASVAVAAEGQNPPSQGAGMRQRGQNMPQAKVVTHNGRPSLEFQGQQGWAFYIGFAPHQGEPALVFPVAQQNCEGTLYITRTRVSGDFHGTPCPSFDVPRASSTAQRQLGTVIVSSGTAKYAIDPEGERDGRRRPIRGVTNGSEFVVRAIDNFDIVFRRLHHMATESRAESGTTMAASKHTEVATKQSPATLSIASDPGDVQVFVNDQSRGMTSEEGHEDLTVPPGSYQVRLSLPGYKDWMQQVTLTAGKKQTITAKLEAAGPPPFSSSDVTEMLEGKMSTKRISTLVEERGVNFDLNPELEKKLRALGGTSDLLLAIAEHKKK